MEQKLCPSFSHFSNVVQHSHSFFLSHYFSLSLSLILSLSLSDSDRCFSIQSFWRRREEERNGKTWKKKRGRETLNGLNSESRYERRERGRKKEMEEEEREEEKRKSVSCLSNKYSGTLRID